MTHRLIVEVRGALKRSANPVKATQMQAYMKSAMPYRGVSSPEQKAIWKAVFTAHPLRSSDEWQQVALTLWRDATFREERYGAVALTGLRQYVSFRTMAALPVFQTDTRDEARELVVMICKRSYDGKDYLLPPRLIDPSLPQEQRVDQLKGATAEFEKLCKLVRRVY